MGSIYFELAVIICLAAVLSVIFRWFKQPALLAYILTGILIGPLGLFKLQNYTALQSLGQIGVTFLLFMLGLELRLKELRSIGLPAVIIGALQVWFTFFIGFLFALKFGIYPAIYIGVALAFSSTIIVVKNLSDKKDLNSLHGKLSIGILLVQDFFAILTIILFTGLKSSTNIDLLQILLLLFLKIAVLVLIVGVISILVPKFIHSIAKSQETLFLCSLAWVFAFTALVTSPLFGFSIEIGGFLAGITLAGSFENYQIAARMKTLRDFFVTIFYVMLGLSITFQNTLSILFPAFILFIFISVFKPFLIFILTSLLGYRKKPAFSTALSMGQISEFSFILMFLGSKTGVLNNSLVTMILLVGIAGFISSSYLTKHSKEIYSKFSKYLSFFESKSYHVNIEKTDDKLNDLKNHLLIVGGHQMGMSLIHALEDSKEKIIVVDFDPDIIKKLEEKGIPAIYGDIADPEIQEKSNLAETKMVVSTIPDLDDNIYLLKALRQTNKKARVVVSALENEDARALYAAGVDYVILPHLAGGRYLTKMLKDNELDTFEWHKARDLVYIN